MEALKSFGYRLYEWEHEHPVNRARVIAHYLERGKREGYLAEKWEDLRHGETNKRNAVPSWARYAQGGGRPDQ